MRFGYWMPVFGGWLRNVDDEGMEASWEYVSRLARRSEEIGFDLTLLAELYLNDIKGEDAPTLEAWSTAAALAAVTERRRLIDDVERAQRDAQHAEQTASSAAQAVADELAVAGHDTIEQARALALPEDERARLDATWNDAVRRVAAAQTSLEDEQERQHEREVSL